MVRILLLLSATVGIPYLLVSSTAPLLQHWFIGLRPGASPYRFYALSNAGSLLGLLTYPLLVEPLFGVRMQTMAWSAGYGLYALAIVVCGALVFRSASTSDGGNVSEEAGSSVPAGDRALWIALAACGVVVLLAATNQMSQDVAVIPLLWVLPLSLYLVSFIVAFGRPDWYHRGFWVPVMVLSIIGVVYLFHQDYADDEVHLYRQYSSTQRRFSDAA
jgi:hypothetical protein